MKDRASQTYGHESVSKKKKILLMGHVDGLGGAQTAYKELYEFVNTEGFEVKFISITDYATIKEPFNSAHLIGKIEHKSVGLISKIKKWKSLLLVGVGSKFFNPDIFIGVGLSNSSIFISRFLNKNCFKIAQDFIADRSKNEKIWNLSRARFNGIAVQAPSMVNYWRNLESDVKGINWLPCFPEQPIEGVTRKNGKEAGHEVRLAYFGRLAGNKGLPLLLHALASLPATDNTTLDLWGTGEEEANLRELTEQLTLGNKIKFAGSYPFGKEGAQLMVSYDAIVLTSTKTEGLPLILLEAMAYGLPFLATDIGAIQDCCINNPDTILVQPVQEDITKGLSVLIHRIKNNEFDTERLMSFYQKTFSYEVMSIRWRECFNNPKLFFYGNE